ncbi:YibE/F family protein [Desulfovibrio sp.]|uniref:YibE/F family protein n=1 Tax=Desulfovibrio sp. TaxID=885 RepID=UPI00344FC1F6
MRQHDEKNTLSGSVTDESRAGQPAAGAVEQQTQRLMAEAHRPLRSTRRDTLLCTVLALACIALYLLPTGFENRLPANAVRCRATVLSVDNERVHQYGIVRMGTQYVTMRALDGPYAGQTWQAGNDLVGKMELDKVFAPGDTALLVLTLRDGKVADAVAQDHYRLHTQAVAFGIFALLLLVFAGVTGLKALLSFVFSALMIWKALVPALLRDVDPILLGLGVTTAITGATILLVGGMNRRGVAAWLGSLLGIATTCALALIFAGPFQLHGAVRPYAETVLYSGYPHLNMTRIFLASIFMASSGALMDLAMDVAASMAELAAQSPGISRRAALASGLRVGRAVVGTMTTTLLLAYSGGYIATLMLFMAQGIPLENALNLPFVSAEIMNTLVGSIGLVTVAPFTALTGTWLLIRPEAAGPAHAREPANAAGAASGGNNDAP